MMINIDKIQNYLEFLHGIQVLIGRFTENPDIPFYEINTKDPLPDKRYLTIWHLNPPFAINLPYVQRISMDVVKIFYNETYPANYQNTKIIYSKFPFYGMENNLQQLLYQIGHGCHDISAMTTSTFAQTYFDILVNSGYSFHKIDISSTNNKEICTIYNQIKSGRLVIYNPSSYTQAGIQWNDGFKVITNCKYKYKGNYYFDCYVQLLYYTEFGIPYYTWINVDNLNSGEIMSYKTN